MDLILYPFAWLLRILYELFNSYGLSLLLFALVIKLILLPFSMKSKKGTMKTARLQPKLKELEKKYAGNKEKYNEEVQKLYKENDVKMLGGCIWSLIPLPILLALYSIIRQPLTYIMQLSKEQISAVSGILTSLGKTVANPDSTYGQIEIAQQIFENFNTVKAAVPQVTKLDFNFFGINLAATPDYKVIFSGNITWAALGLFLIPIVSAVLAYVSTKISMMGSAQTEQQNMKSMTLMAPIMSLWIGFIMPAGLGIYWIGTSLFAMIQDYILAKYYGVVLDKEDAARIDKQRAIEEERERKRIEYERLKAENANTRNKNTSKKKVQKVERSESEKKEAEFEKKKLVEKGVIAPEAKIDESRPYARGRAFDPNRLPPSSRPAEIKEKASPAPVDSEAAAREAARKDEEAFEKFLATGKIDDEAAEDTDENT